MDILDAAMKGLTAVVVPITGYVVKLGNRVTKVETQQQAVQDALDRHDKKLDQILEHLLDQKRG